MGYARFSFRPINARPLAEILQNGGAEQISPVSNLRVAGHCCRGAVALWQGWAAHQTAQARAKRLLKNSHEYCCAVTWYELGRTYRRWEARGEIRGGYFVGGVSGEQFALPEAIGLLRSVRKSSSNGVLITLSAADPLNLHGIVTPGKRIPAFTANRLLFRDGLPVAALESGEIRKLSDECISDLQIENALRVGKLRPSL